MSWSPDGKYLASAGFDGITAIWERDVDSGEFECVATLEGHENEVKSVSWSRSGDMLATCSRDKSVWIWAADSDKEFECLSVLNGHTQDVKVARWHPTQAGTLFSASYDNSIKVWSEDEEDFYCVATLNAHTSTVWSIAFDTTRQGERMASASDDRNILIWQHLQPSAEGATSIDTAAAAAAAATSDANTLAAPKSGAGPVWKLTGALRNAHTRCIYSIDWSTDGKLASGGADDAIRIFGAPSTTAAPAVAPAPAPATAAAASPMADANAAAAAVTPVADPAASTPASALSTPATTLPAAPADLTLLYTQKGAHAGDVNCVSWNPTNPSLLCSAGDDGLIKIWRLT